MTTSVSDAKFSLAFVGFYDSGSPEDIRGAAMVTTDRGFPLEFYVSTPVRPSAVQKALYGSSLEPFITAELLGVRLLNDIKADVKIVLVNRLGGLDIDTDVPTMFVAHADSFVQQNTPGRDYRRLEGQGVELPSIALVGDSLNMDQANVDYVAEAMRYFDPVAAFDRMFTALSVLAESDERYS